MSVRTDVLLWAQRVLARKGAPAHQLLEIKADATIDDAQNAFHKIARTSHPDLHRGHLSADELESVTSAYAVVAGAYQSFRSHQMQTQRIKMVDGPATERAVPATPAGPAPAGIGAASQMNGKALVYYRKAEMALNRGDLRGALLQIKMAIAADPASAFLRSALAEVEQEVRKGS